MKVCVASNGNVLQEGLLKDELAKRIPVTFSDEGLSISLEIDSSIAKKDSFRITKTDNGYTLTGSDSRGLSYAVGKFLHTAKWTKEEMIPNPPTGIQSPDCSFRAMYFSIHCYNWYHMAPTKELEQYCKDLLLYGYDTIVSIVPVLNMDAFDDEVAKDTVEKTREIFRLCRKLGLRTGLIICANQGLQTAPKELWADLSFSTDPKTGAGVRPTVGKNICVSKPEGMAYMRWIFEEEMKLFTETGLDVVVTFPYDEGGCGCEKCRPWGANGYLNACITMYDVVQKFYPGCEFVVPTWMFDMFEGENEYEGMYKRLKTDCAFIDRIMVDAHNHYPTYPLTHPVIKPIVGFPEISMYGLYPWGGFGANPLIDHFQEIWDEQKPVSDGGMPYSEGCYEDINKILFSGFYWDKDRKADDIMEEYVNYEFSSDYTKEIVKIMHNIDNNHVRVKEHNEPDCNLAIETEKMAREIDTHIEEPYRSSWRWRILYIRAILDGKRHAYYKAHNMRGPLEQNLLRHYSSDWLVLDEEAQDLLKELISIYHVLDHDNGHNRWTRPLPGGGTCMHSPQPEFVGTNNYETVQ